MGKTLGKGSTQSAMKAPKKAATPKMRSQSKPKQVSKRGSYSSTKPKSKTQQAGVGQGLGQFVKGAASGLGRFAQGVGSEIGKDVGAAKNLGGTIARGSRRLKNAAAGDFFDKL